jgi:hypothetical protein
LTGLAREQLHVACPPGRLADTVTELGIPLTRITDTAGSLRLHPAHTPRALAEMSLAALQVRRAATRHAAQVVHGNSIRAGVEVGLARVSPAASVVSVGDILPPGRAAARSRRGCASASRWVGQVRGDPAHRRAPRTRAGDGRSWAPARHRELRRWAPRAGHARPLSARARESACTYPGAHCEAAASQRLS